MTDEEIQTKLTQVFHQVLEDDKLVLTPDLTAEDVEGWDSMNHIFIVVEIEKQFGIKFQAAEMEELKNVGELSKLLEYKLAKRS